MTTALWRLTAAKPALTADLVVIGAGICGISAALAAQRRGLRVLVVDRLSVAGGASGRNAGFLMRGAADNYQVAIDLYGRDRARTLWRWTEENLAGLRAEGAESLASFRRVPSCLLALEEAEHAELRRSADLLREDGFEVSWLDRHDDTAWRSARPLGGLLNPGDASTNPVDLLGLLASKLAVRPFENREVRAVSIEPAAGLARVHTDDATFTAPRVLICTNAYAPQLVPALSAVITPRRGQMLALRSPGAKLDFSYYANRGYEYFRQTPDGTIALGGCRKAFAEQEVGYEDRTTPPVQRALEQFGERLFAKGFEVVTRWSGVMGFSPDGLPLIGPLDAPPPAARVWFCSACTGHGMSLSYRAAHAAIEHMLGGAASPFPLSRVLAPGHEVLSGSPGATSGRAVAVTP